jgi:aspartate oxidase
MGGVDVDLDGCTSVSGLWAAGEVACTGVHGANRLASNSLLEGLVFGARVARSVGEALAPSRQAKATLAPLLARPALPDAANETAVASEIRGLMWEAVGLVRTGQGLQQALDRLEALEARLPPGGPTRNQVTVARLVATAALARPESRGAHFRADHPLTDPAWRKRILLTRDGSGTRLETEPVPAADPNAVEVCA